jgi:hypothetical protein
MSKREKLVPVQGQTQPQASVRRRGKPRPSQLKMDKVVAKPSDDAGRDEVKVTDSVYTFFSRRLVLVVVSS